MQIDFNRARLQSPYRARNYLVGRDRRHLTYAVVGGGLLLIFLLRFNDILFLTHSFKNPPAPLDTRVKSESRQPALPPLPGTVALQPFDSASLAGDFAAENPAADSNAPLQQTAPLQADPPQAQPAANLPPAQPQPAQPQPAEKQPGEKQPGEKQPVMAQIFTGLDPAKLAMIKDSTFTRAAEYDVWYHILGVLSKTTPEQLTAEATPVRLFRELYTNPGTFRGRAIQLRGHLIWYQEMPAGADNPLGLDKYYEVGLGLQDQKDTPVFVYCLELPPDLPRGVADPTLPRRFHFPQKPPRISVTGIFYKLLIYKAVDEERKAPAMLAQTVSLAAAREPTAEKAPLPAPSVSPEQWLFAALLISGVVFVGLFWFFWRKKTTFEIPQAGDQMRRQKLGIEPVVDEDPREALRKLAEAKDLPL
ncbi:MAG: hypothetical protein SFX18_05310 [Pirellulales bacterium]|nr:hypothetical protein [Pirellulales bacterium]